MSSLVEPTIMKICIVGDTNTGKTSLQTFFVKKRFKRNYHPTIGSDFSFKEMRTKGGSNYRLAIWDLSGDDKYKQSHSTYYQGISGLIAVFDLTRRETLDSLISWLNSIEKIVPLTFPIFLVGNKKDLVHFSSDTVSDNDVRNMRIRFNESQQTEVEFYSFKTSAKTGENVEDLFNHLIETIDSYK